MALISGLFTKKVQFRSNHGMVDGKEKITASILRREMAFSHHCPRFFHFSLDWLRIIFVLG